MDFIPFALLISGTIIAPHDLELLHDEAAEISPSIVDFWMEILLDWHVGHGDGLSFVLSSSDWLYTIPNAFPNNNNNAGITFLPCI